MIAETSSDLRASVIIPVYNLADVTRRCLVRVLDTIGPDDEVIVVDDASRDETPAMLASFGVSIRTVRHATNLGFAVGCNDGAALARGRFPVFLNNDTEPSDGWLDALVGHAQEHPRAGAVGAKLLYPDGTIQHAGMAFDQDHHPRHIYVGFPGDHPAVNRSRRFAAVTGACVLITREAFAAVGGFDTGYANGFEDVDLCLQLVAAGYEVHYCHACEVVHLESVSEGRDARTAANVARFRARWHDRIVPDDWSYYAQDGLIRIEYGESCPIRVSVAPELGVADHPVGSMAEVHRLLAWRARQVQTLLKDGIRHRLRSHPEAASA